MNDTRKRIDDMVNEIRCERDELQVKLHLARLELGDEWNKLEEKLVKLEEKAKELGSVTAESSQNIGAAAKLLGEEIRDGFKEIGKHL